MKKTYQILAFLLVGFCGGVLGVSFMGWLNPILILGASEAIAIANTYIVFTTIIFVGFTVVITVASFVFTQQFAKNQEAEMSKLMEVIRDKLRDDEECGIDFINDVLDNPDVRTHINDKMGEKLNQLIEEKKQNLNQTASKTETELEAVDGIAQLLTDSNGGRDDD